LFVLTASIDVFKNEAATSIVENYGNLMSYWTASAAWTQMHTGGLFQRHK